MAGSGEQGARDPLFHSGEPGAQSPSGWWSLKLRVPRRPALQGPPAPRLTERQGLRTAPQGWRLMSDEARGSRRMRICKLIFILGGTGAWLGQSLGCPHACDFGGPPCCRSRGRDGAPHCATAWPPMLSYCSLVDEETGPRKIVACLRSHLPRKEVKFEPSGL